MTELLVGLGLIAGVVAAHEIGFWLGSFTRSADEPFDRQIALVRTSTAALVAFLVGFAFSGAASRFTNRLVPRDRGFDGLIPSQFRMGRSSGATRICMLRATPG